MHTKNSMNLKVLVFKTKGHTKGQNDKNLWMSRQNNTWPTQTSQMKRPSFCSKSKLQSPLSRFQIPTTHQQSNCKVPRPKPNTKSNNAMENQCNKMKPTLKFKIHNLKSKKMKKQCLVQECKAQRPKANTQSQKGMAHTNHLQFYQSPKSKIQSPKALKKSCSSQITKPHCIHPSKTKWKIKLKLWHLTFPKNNRWCATTTLHLFKSLTLQVDTFKVDTQRQSMLTLKKK